MPAYSFQPCVAGAWRRLLCPSLQRMADHPRCCPCCPSFCGSPACTADWGMSQPGSGRETQMTSQLPSGILTKGAHSALLACFCKHGIVNDDTSSRSCNAATLAPSCITTILSFRQGFCGASGLQRSRAWQVTLSGCLREGHTPQFPRTASAGGQSVSRSAWVRHKGRTGLKRAAYRAAPRWEAHSLRDWKVLGDTPELAAGCVRDQIHPVPILPLHTSLACYASSLAMKSRHHL